MSYNLIRDDDGVEFGMTNYIWERILEIADDNGWISEGTFILNDDGDVDEDWDCSYTGNCGQGVTKDDAEQLYDVLVHADIDDPVELDVIKKFLDWGHIDGESVGFEIH